MAIPTVAAVGATTPTPQSVKPRFSEVLKPPVPRASAEVGPTPVVSPARAAPTQAKSAPRASAGCVEAKPSAGVHGAKVPHAAQLVDRVARAQQQLDSVLRQAERGKTFTPAELVALQAKVYRASQEIDLAGKVVEKATGGVKQILQTQV
jgi:hypothetical protein